MNSMRLPPSSSISFSLTLMTGKEKGVVYELVQTNILIGRDRDCDICLAEDEKCSRKHARIRLINDLILLTNITDKNIVLVNGTPITEAYVDDRCIITIGSTQLQLKIKRSLQNFESHLGLPHLGQNHPFPQFKTSKNKNSLPFILILIVILGGGIWFFSSPSSKKKETIETTEQRLLELDKKLESLSRNPQSSQNLTISQKMAKGFFIKGLRDYQQGQYSQSASSFQACLGHWPEYTVCQKYFHLARKKFDELLQYQINLGRRYYEQGLHDDCISIFRNIMFNLKDTQSKIFIEAQKTCQLCESESDGRFKCRPDL